MFDRVRLNGTDRVFPAEYKDLEDAMIKGDASARAGDTGDAERFYLLVLNRGNLLEKEFVADQKRRADAARLRVEAEMREQERKTALLAEQLKLAKARAAAEAAAMEAEAARKKAEKVRQQREKPLPSYHTVKRGESLPQIASQQDVYNEANLWPIIYRANRDQISDPRHIWPGQVLRIPRNATREDIQEARRYAQDKPLH
ncbi:LysM peptidoglycan-binding domain-containing protein [Geobacter sp. AOG1]|uniref:LysM peptidoglycan-binding domain-containing protein n=1 Tax=Geobacter sp. AOG1 TaxID=1566346 RepID=UPI001CC6CC69|nr:LysM peptidoglycan-binding domain-containing protein [Geobacter sp. AOG1]